MGWLRFIGSLKLQVSFAKEPDKEDYTVQKRPIILRSLLIVATQYSWAEVSEDNEVFARLAPHCAVPRSEVCCRAPHTRQLCVCPQ